MSTSNPSIYKTVSHSIINNTIFWKCVTRPFRCIDENCFNRLRFLAKVSTKSQKMHFFRQFRTIIQEKNMKTRQMTPFFHLLFLLQLFVTFISEFESTQNVFSCGPLFGPFLPVKYFNFWPKAPNLDNSNILF